VHFVLVMEKYIKTISLGFKGKRTDENLFNDIFLNTPEDRP